jgi:preprotein translocase subunit SecE
MKKQIEVLTKFLKETRAETKKVAWPNRRQVSVATLIILVLVFITGLYVMLVDYGLTKIFGFLIK